MDLLTAINLFNKVIETGSFSEAGRQSNLSTSSVSRRIVELEEWVGATLFHRTTRKLNFTEAGRKFHEKTKGLLLDLEEARIVAGQLEETPHGHIKLTTPASLEQHIVVAASLFQARWPDVSFNLISTDRQVDLIAEGFDLAIRAGTLKDSTLMAKRIVNVRRRLCASPQYLATAPKLSRPEDISDHNCLILGRNKSTANWVFTVDEETVEIEVFGSMNANSGNMLVSAARHGRGLILSPDWILGPYLAKGELVELLPAFSPSPATTSLYAVHPYRQFVPPKVRLFIDYLAEHFSDDFDWSVNPSDSPLPDLM